MENDFAGKYYHSSDSKTTKAFRIIGMVLIGLVFVVLFALVFGFLVKWIWNLIMPDLFGLIEITYWQAFGMVILAKLLFGAFGSHHYDHWGKRSRPFSEWHDRFKLYGDEPWNRRNRHWKSYQEYWQEQGRSAFEEYMRSKEKADHKD